MEGFFDCDEGLKQVPKFKSGEELSGCTGVVSLLTKQNIIVGNSGDSRCILVRGGEVVFGTRDHKPDDVFFPFFSIYALFLLFFTSSAF